MFTGLVQDIGEIALYEKDNSDLTIGIKTNLDVSAIAIGASICCSGCCLTVVKKEENTLFFEVSNETLSCTILGSWQLGSKVNLEKSLAVGDELGGHFVSGHIDAVTTVLEITPDDGSHRIIFEHPKDMAHFIAPKGSITIDGVSLTVNEVTEKIFSVTLFRTLGNIQHWAHLHLKAK